MIGVFHMEIIDDPQAVDAGGHLAHGLHLKFFQNVADLGFHCGKLHAAQTADFASRVALTGQIQKKLLRLIIA